MDKELYYIGFVDKNQGLTFLSLPFEDKDTEKYYRWLKQTGITVKIVRVKCEDIQELTYMEEEIK